MPTCITNTDLLNYLAEPTLLCFAIDGATGALSFLAHRIAKLRQTPTPTVFTLLPSELAMELFLTRRLSASTVSDVDEFDTTAISDTNATTNSVAENSAIGTAVGVTAFASDADATTNTITYSLDNNAGRAVRHRQLHRSRDRRWIAGP